MYQLVYFDRRNGTIRIAVFVSYKNTYNTFDQTLEDTDTSLSDEAVCQQAWKVFSPHVEGWKSQVDAGEYLVNATFVPQPDGTLQFVV